MSRIGKLPIKVSKDINLQIEQNIIQISGKQGTLKLNIPNITTFIWATDV